MMNRLPVIIVVLSLIFFVTASIWSPSNQALDSYTLGYCAPVDPALQAELGKIDAGLRVKYGLTAAQTAVGLLDLNRLRWR